MSMELTQKKCEPCEAGTPPMRGAEVERYAAELSDRWKVEEEHHLQGEFKFKNFMEALDFTNRAGELAEDEGHHPDICLTWGKASVKIYTHAIDGLSENDFILAAKIDRLLD